ncbi:ESX secretion-associated protein EspG [Amycolatopsis sp. lyj-84]|uniref:ESX secretion-associated protein EspG n=1 Tax=Amycolatopsis sp. lyj-84 TaxID=2789284 RepID=UPI00397C23A3
MLRKPVELTLQTYETLLDQNNLGDIHPTLVRGAQWYLPEERRALAATAQSELDRQGLLTRGRIDAEFLDTLRFLQRPAVEYYSWVKSEGRERTVRAAGSGREALTVVLVDKVVYLKPTRPDTLAQDFTGLLPEAPAARTPSLNCSEADLQVLMKGEMLTGGGPSIRDAKKIFQWIRSPHTFFGRLYVAIRDGGGNRKRVEKPPGWMDTEQGRVVFGPDTKGWVSLMGAGPHEIAAKVIQLESQLRGR